MYLSLWDDFYQQSIDLYKSDPDRTRYSFKYKPTGLLVFKTTNDVKCLKYKTDRINDLNKLERMNLTMMQLMQTGTFVEVEDPKPEQKKQETKDKKKKRK
ncbi:signal recognition particle 9 kDa protein [Gorgonomyces haynaldii]|nr:signal recognition particle 9 kDa protein [Gorgonomyces haynaldii]